MTPQQTQQERAPVQLHYNRPQLEFQLVMASVNACVWGRRTGKTEGPMADFTLHNLHTMPRANGLIGGTTYEQLLTRTLPPLVAAWEKRGYYQGTHFWVRKFPPAALRVPRAYRSPLEPTHYIQWWNGSGIYLVSQDRPGTSNGVASQWQAWDEAKFLNHDKLKEEALLTLSGCAEHFGHMSNYLSLLFCSDRPTSSKGKWLLDFEAQMDPEQIRLILALSVRSHQLRLKLLEAKSKGVATRLSREIQKLEETLNELRKDCVYFSKASTLDNIHALGLAPIRQFRRTLNPAVFDASVLNLDVIMVENGFYALLDEDQHAYDDFNYTHIDQLELSLSAEPEKDCRWDNDVQADKPLHIACDYNSDINCVVVGQPDQRTTTRPLFRFLNALYVKHPELLKECAQRFIRYYQYHANKTVYYYYDHTAIGKNASTDISFADEWMMQLRMAGWNAIPRYIGQASSHESRYLLWQATFKGTDRRLPIFRYNRTNCNALVVAMQQAGTKTRDGRTFKNKDPEKDPQVPAEEATHLTEAADQLWWGTQRAKFTATGGSGSDYNTSY